MNYDNIRLSSIVGRDPESGKPIRKTYYGKTRQELSTKLVKAQGELLVGAFVDPGAITVGHWMDTWLYQYKKKSVRPSTFASYETMVRVHIKPSIGHILLKDLRPEHLQRLYNGKLEQGRGDGAEGGLSSRTVRYVHIVVHQALSQAVKNQLLIRNVSEATILPRQEKKEMRVLSQDEQGKFFEVIEQDPTCFGFILLLATGLRQGELLGLRWNDIDLNEGIVHVRRSLTRTRIFDEKSETRTQIIEQEPKTRAGKRKIPLPPSVLEALKVHKERQDEIKSENEDQYVDKDLVICTDLGKPKEPRNFTRKFKGLIKRAELANANLHSLRHPYVKATPKNNLSFFRMCMFGMRGRREWLFQPI